MAWGQSSSGRTYRAQWAVLHVVHRELHLCVLADIRVLEKGNAAEVGRVNAALRTNQNTSWFPTSNLIYAHVTSAAIGLTLIVSGGTTGMLAVVPQIFNPHTISDNSEDTVVTKVPQWPPSGHVWSRRPGVVSCNSQTQNCWVCGPKWESRGWCRL